MTRAANDATLQKAGDIYQYLIALRDCFELNDGDTLQIETNGDVSIINDVGGRFQREVKHHFGNKSISDRDIDFWKTLANWYVDYERVKNFSNYILSTTATIQSDSPFHSWNNIKKTEKLKRLKEPFALEFQLLLQLCGVDPAADSFPNRRFKLRGSHQTPDHIGYRVIHNILAPL